MNDKAPEPGTMTWVDLTVEDAEAVREFYTAVVGWQSAPVDMGGYNDFNMTGPESGHPLAGICHRRGINEDLPAQWLVYVTVADVEKSAARVVELGGEIVLGPKSMGTQGRYAVIRDPAGAVLGLFEVPKEPRS